ncbi:transcription repressor OFP15 [Mangifera indica]|uniref:transcription repressor OFP15 n=1 Tax=Mangifera indica TaxID=29780 RepID=UPI001CF93C26|nr:transcription repressor OFP15 [Mangifera indica]
MGKKMKLPNFLSKNNSTTRLARSSSWPWPSCHQPRTPSFRTNYNNNNNHIVIIDNNTINSACKLDLLDDHHLQATRDSSWFTTTSTASEEEWRAVDSSVESVIKGLKFETERLFFEPGETSSILEEAKTGGFPFKKSLVLSMESQDPYVDFRKSMEEMVEAHGLKDWEDLEELLSCYLRVNGNSNHGYIVRAFVDLLVALALSASSSSSSSSSKTNTATTTCYSSSLASPCCCSRSPSSPLSFFTSSSEDSSSTPCTVSLLQGDAEEEEIEQKDNTSSSS